MSAFQEGNGVSAKGYAILIPYLDELADGRLVLSDKGKLAKWLQESVGDVVMQQDGRMWWVEIKTEETSKWGNFFLEIWSNRNLDVRESHAERGSNPGWLSKLRADLLLYYFLDTDDLYSIDLFSLQRWAYGYNNKAGNEVAGNLHRFREKVQSKRVQMNDTIGVCVPIKVLQEELPRKAVKQTKVKQRELTLEPI